MNPPLHTPRPLPCTSRNAVTTQKTRLAAEKQQRHHTVHNCTQGTFNANSTHRGFFLRNGKAKVPRINAIQHPLTLVLLLGKTSGSTPNVNETQSVPPSCQPNGKRHGSKHETTSKCTVPTTVSQDTPVAKASLPSEHTVQIFATLRSRTLMHLPASAAKHQPPPSLPDIEQTDNRRQYPTTPINSPHSPSHVWLASTL